MPMRTGLCLAALLMALSGGARADGKPVYDEGLTVEMQGIVGEACFGDRYETDDDINEGNRISDEEIRLILDRLIS